MAAVDILMLIGTNFLICIQIQAYIGIYFL